MVSLKISAEGQRDIDDACRWYEGQGIGLSQAFLACVVNCMERIRRNPEIYVRIRGENRMALVHRFPYAVFYEYRDEVVTVFCVLHTSRDPEKWRARMG